MEDLQNLLEKINRDGVEKAEAEAKKIIAAATAEAQRILKEATDGATQLRANAEKDAAVSAQRATEAIRQSARDLLLGTKDALTATFERLLLQNVDKALANESVAAELVLSAVKGLMGPGEIVCGAKLAQALKAQLAACGSFTLVTDETRGTGFSVKLDNGRVEHAYTSEVIAAELAKRVRPELAKLIG